MLLLIHKVWKILQNGFCKILPQLQVHTYSEADKFKHPISKVLQWLPWYVELCEGRDWGHILLSWECFL